MTASEEGWFVAQKSLPPGRMARDLRDSQSEIGAGAARIEAARARTGRTVNCILAVEERRG